MAANASRYITYYRCPHNPSSPRHAAASPGHPRSVQAPEPRLEQLTARFFLDHIFGPQRAALLAATGTDAIARRDEADAETQLTALTASRPRAADPAILDEIPYAGDILPALPPALKARLFAAFDLSILWNKTGNQATVHAEITDATLRALPAILNPDRDGYHDTAAPAGTGNTTPASAGQLAQPPITGSLSHSSAAARS
jgi:hypothetical protein